MKPAPFAYVRPETLGELSELLAVERENARILAGGMSLGPMLNMRLVTPRVLVDINRIPGLGKIELQKGNLLVGATVRQEQALRHALVASEVPLLREALTHVGHYQTRSRGTLCGSIAHAEPSAELPLTLLVTEGEVQLASRKGLRVVPSERFFVSPLQTSRRADEFVASVTFKRQKANQVSAFSEFAERAGDFAIVACACMITFTDGTIADIRLGLSGVGDTPTLIDCSSLKGRAMEMEAALVAKNLVSRSIAPRGDTHASADYRRHLCGVLTESAIASALGKFRRVASVSG